MEKRGPRTLEEVQKELESDPEFQRRKAQQEERRRRRTAALREEEKPLVEDLAAAGLKVASVWDLVNTRRAYPEAIDILSRHLNKGYSDRIREGIVRALTVPDARGVVGEQLIRLFETESDDDIRWVIGNALAVVATEAQTEDLRRLLADRAFGESRSELIRALARLVGRDAVHEIMDFLDDSDCANSAIVTLGNLRATEAEGALEPFVEHPDSYVRDIAKKALKKIRRAAKE